ncbi:hypothetical protein CDD83_4448 [Cordyceps sp. RAO-2017]|nr:hypothetical protein CDD83_4448 [Cordyceps sp. RAO-2017]
MKVISGSVLTAALLAADFAGLVAAQSYACPGNKGETIVRGGKKYELLCDKGFRGAAIEEKACDSLAECAERCAANPKCVHGTLIGKSQKCALKAAGDAFDLAGLSTWKFVELAKETETKPPPPVDETQKPIGGGGGGGGSTVGQSSYSCPADKNKKYTTNGITYELRCDTGHKVTHWTSDPCPSLKECADRCAKTAECYSCDYARSSKTCFLKKAPSETVPWTEGDAWFPAPCPDVRETEAKKEPEITSGLNCPSDNGKIWEGSDGTWFYLQCCTDTSAATVIEQGTASSHKDCLEKCVANKKCRR